MTDITDPATLAAIQADQLAPMALPPLAPVSGSAAYLCASAAAPGRVTLGDWFPAMPLLDAQGGTSGLLLRTLTIDVAQLVYINAPAPLSPAALAAMLGGATPYGPVQPGGALLFHGTAGLAAFGPLQALAGVPIPDLPMAGMVDFSTGFPRLTLAAALTGPTGPVANLQLALSCPLYPTPGDASFQLSATIPISATDQLDVLARIVPGGPVFASATLDSATAGRLAGSLAAPGLPTLGASESLTLTALLGRNGNWFTLDRIGFSASVSNWELLPGLVTIEAATLAVQVIDPTGARQVIATLTCTARFGKAGLALTGTGAYPAGAFTLSLAGPATVAQFLGEFGIQDAALEALTITTCALSVDRQIGVASAQLALAGSWTVGPFTLTGLSLALQGPGTISAAIAASCVLGGVAFAAAARYAGGAWSVTASAIAGPGGLTLAPVLAALKLPAPGFVDALALDGFAVTWGATGLIVQIEGTLPLGPGVTVSLTLSDGHPAVAGELRVGAFTLDLVLDGDAVTATMPPTDLQLAALASAFDLPLPAALTSTMLTGCAMQLEYGPAPA